MLETTVEMMRKWNESPDSIRRQGKNKRIFKFDGNDGYSG